MLLAAARPGHWLIGVVSVVLSNYQSDEENLTCYLSSFPIISCISESLIQLIFGNFILKAQVEDSQGRQSTSQNARFTQPHALWKPLSFWGRSLRNEN